METRWCSGTRSRPTTIPSCACCASSLSRSSPRSMAPPRGPAPMSRSPATSCWRRARQASSRPLPRSGWCRIAAAPGSCRGSWGPPRARGLALPAEPLPAEKAEAWGLIWKAVDDFALLAEAHKLCLHFASAPTVGLALCKRLLDQSWSNDLDAQLDLERESQREASLTPDYAEGVHAFLGKRPPVFTGRRGS